MRFVRFTTSDYPALHYGCIVDEKIKIIKGNPFKDYDIGSATLELDEVQLLSPCSPGKIIGLAANYHGATGVTRNMKEPIVFLKPGSSATGPYDDIICPFRDIRVWGEIELGIVIGKRTKNVSKISAKKAIFGYLCANDITAENIDNRDHHLARSKGIDAFCPIGPWIDTEFNAQEAVIESYQNGKLIRQGNLKDMIWKSEKIVYWLSQWMTLQQGDLIITGTPPRVVEKTYLANGDIYEGKIKGLGTLKNKFICHSQL